MWDCGYRHSKALNELQNNKKGQCTNSALNLKSKKLGAKVI